VYGVVVVVVILEKTGCFSVLLFRFSFFRRDCAGQPGARGEACPSPLRLIPFWRVWQGGATTLACSVKLFGN